MLNFSERSSLTSIYCKVCTKKQMFKVWQMIKEVSFHSGATHQKHKVTTVFIVICLIHSMGRITNKFHWNAYLWRQRSWINSSVRQFTSTGEFFSWHKFHGINKIFTVQSHIKVIYNLIKISTMYNKKLRFDIVCTVHHNQLYKQTNKMHFLYVFILQCFTTLYDSNDHFIHNQEFMIYCILQLCTNHVTVSNCLVLPVPTVRPSSYTRLHGLYRAAEYSTSWTPDDEWNGHSKHVELYKNCRINTYRKFILLVFLYKKPRIRLQAEACEGMLEACNQT